ncbi:MAG: SRPBCC family protein [Acidimicrobiia bacterium]|nr:SRPBCC family protein [Acidimicrobiia bacterium]
MSELKVERFVKAPAEIVWRVITDIDGATQRISGINRIESLDQKNEFGIGTRWRETRTMFGREATEVMEVTEIEEGRSYVTEAHNKAARYVSTMWVEPADGGSTVGMSFFGEPQGTIAKVFAGIVGRFFEGGTRKAMEQDLIDVAAAAEDR